MITIYYHCFDMTPDDEIFVAGALKELAQHLKVDPKDDPIKLSVSIKRLGDEPDLAKEVDPELNRLNDPSYRFSDSAAQIVNIFVRVLGVPESFVVPRLLVYCHKDSQVAKAALREKPSALWGCTCGFFGVYTNAATNLASGMRQCTCYYYDTMRRMSVTNPILLMKRRMIANVIPA